MVIFNNRSAYSFFVTSTIRLLLQVVFAILGATFAERNLSIAKEKSFSSLDSMTMKLWKEVTFLLCFCLYMCQSVPEWDLLSNLYRVHRVGRVFANGSGGLGSIPVRIIPKTLKMVLDTSLLNTRHYKVHIKGKVEQSREKSSALPYISV